MGSTALPTSGEGMSFCKQRLWPALATQCVRVLTAGQAVDHISRGQAHQLSL
ncbi:hypothetical protein SynPROS71_00788 [Synechococcus sp. PROS-7-1]|nr:hypothetical protein SynPROS71_00788 [Synechococcus sp. PROS-7-1]